MPDTTRQIGRNDRNASKIDGKHAMTGRLATMITLRHHGFPVPAIVADAPRPLRRLAATALGGLTLCGLLLTGCGSPAREPDTADLEPYVRHYVHLLNEADEPGLADLLANPSQPQDAADRIAEYGRKGLHDVRATWPSPEFYGAYRVTIVTTDSRGTTVRCTETIAWESDHWTMAPLHARPPSNLPPPATVGTSP
jgi:hypothetical protein